MFLDTKKVGDKKSQNKQTLFFEMKSKTKQRSKKTLSNLFINALQRYKLAQAIKYVFEIIVGMGNEGFVIDKINLAFEIEQSRLPRPTVSVVKGN